MRERSRTSSSDCRRTEDLITDEEKIYIFSFLSFFFSVPLLPRFSCGHAQEFARLVLCNRDAPGSIGVCMNE